MTASEPASASPGTGTGEARISSVSHSPDQRPSSSRSFPPRNSSPPTFATAVWLLQPEYADVYGHVFRRDDDSCLEYADLNAAIEARIHEYVIHRGAPGAVPRVVFDGERKLLIGAQSSPDCLEALPADCPQ